MKLEKRALFVPLAALMLTGCQREPADERPDSERQPIVLNGEAGPVVRGSMGPTTDFPNGGNINVIAKRISDYDWTTPYINNVGASATSKVGAIYYFGWNSGSTQYWPLDGGELDLIAYSCSNAALTTSGAVLNVTLPANNSTMPDLMYGQWIARGDKTPAHRDVSFGTFSHALSQLTVNLVANQAGPPIVLKQFSITTKSQATLNLIDHQVVVSPTNTVTYSYPSQPVLADQTTYVLEAATGKPFLLYEDFDGQTITTITVTLTDGAGGGAPVDVTQTLNISDFKLSNGSGARLRRGERATLTITVKGVMILTNALIGTIDPWIPRGDFGLTIE